MGFSYGKSGSWAISVGGSAGLVPLAGVSVYGVTLLDVTNQIFFSGCLAGSSLGAGLKAGATVSTFSPTFFRVAKPMYSSDFDNSLCGLLDLSLVVGAGGSLTGLTIYGVPHTPSVLAVGGLTMGASGGVTLSPLLYLYVSDKGVQNKGCRIAPEGDPLCGGSSKDPAQSIDPGMSVAR